MVIDRHGNVMQIKETMMIDREFAIGSREIVIMLSRKTTIVDAPNQWVYDVEVLDYQMKKRK